MFCGRQRRIVCVWFPRLASDGALRARPLEGPFALTLRQGNAERLHCLNRAAEAAGLFRGMALAEARVFCAALQTRPADLHREAQLLAALRRWATRYSPWVGLDGEDGLALDITGAAHLFGGEAGVLADLRARLSRAGFSACLGLASSRGAAWALAHHGEGVAPPGEDLAAIAGLPVAALRLAPETVTALQRLGLRHVGDLARTPRAPLARRFGAVLLDRLDAATGAAPEPLTPGAEPPRFALRLTLPEPIGLVADVQTGTARLLAALCERLAAQQTGARVLRLTLRRVDRDTQEVELRLAAALRDPARILPLFTRGIEAADAGFGIDQLRLEAVQVEPLAAQQLGTTTAPGDPARLGDLLSRIGTRIGLENILRLLPADSHVPERGFLTAPAAFSRPARGWSAPRPRPLVLFPPEPVAAAGSTPPRAFRWRRMALSTARAEGPERLAPEWWFDDPAWRSGLRDYWRIETRQGRRLWLFHTPQEPGWWVQGEFA